MQGGVTRTAIGRAHLEDVTRGHEARGRGTCHTWRAQTTASSWTFTNRPDWSCARRQQRTHARTAKMQGAQRPVVLGEGVEMRTCRAASANEASHSIAFAVEHATDGPPVVAMPRSRRDRAEIARRSLRDRSKIARRSLRDRAWHGGLDAVAVVVVGEVRVEDGAEIARLLVLRGVEREPDPGTRGSQRRSR